MKKRLDDDWITIKGTHVLVDDDKNIKSGPEKLQSLSGNRRLKISGEMTPSRSDYDFEPDDDRNDWIHKNVDKLQDLYDEGGSQALNDEWYKFRMADTTKNIHQITQDEADEIIYDSPYVTQSLYDGWFRNADSSYKPKLTNAILSSPEMRNAGLNLAYENYRNNVDKPVSFERFLVTPIKVYRGEKGQKHIKDDVFDAYTFDRKMAEHFAGPNGNIIETEVRPIDTYGSMRAVGEAEIWIPRKLSPVGRTDEEDVKKIGDWEWADPVRWAFEDYAESKVTEPEFSIDEDLLDSIIQDAEMIELFASSKSEKDKEIADKVIERCVDSIQRSVGQMTALHKAQNGDGAFFAGELDSDFGEKEKLYPDGTRANMDAAWDEWLEEHLEDFESDDEQIKFRDGEWGGFKPKDAEAVEDVDSAWDAYKKKKRVEAFRERRQKRLDAKAEEGRWVTTENDHKIHINEEGVPDKGNPHVIKAMEGGQRGHGSGKKRISEGSFPKEMLSPSVKKNTVAIADYISNRCDDEDVLALLSCGNERRGYRAAKFSCEKSADPSNWRIRMTHGRDTGRFLSVEASLPDIEKIKDKEQAVRAFVHEWTHYLDAMARDGLEFGSFTEKFEPLNNALKENDSAVGEEAKKIFRDFEMGVNSGREEGETEAQKRILEMAKEKYGEDGKCPKWINEENGNVKGFTAKQIGVAESVLKRYRKDRDKILDDTLEEYEAKSSEKMSGVPDLQSLYDSLSGGELTDKGEIEYGHGSEYFKSVKEKTSEMLADYVALKATRPDLLKVFERDKPEVASCLDAAIKGMVDRFGGVRIQPEVEEFRGRRQKRLDAKKEDVEWITVNGAHVPIDDDGSLGGKVGETIEKNVEKAEKKTKGSEKRAPLTKKRINQSISDIVKSDKADDEKIEAIRNELNKLPKGSKIQMPDSWENDNGTIDKGVWDGQYWVMNGGKGAYGYHMSMDDLLNYMNTADDSERPQISSVAHSEETQKRRALEREYKKDKHRQESNGGPPENYRQAYGSEEEYRKAWDSAVSSFDSKEKSIEDDYNSGKEKIDEKYGSFSEQRYEVRHNENLTEEERENKLREIEENVKRRNEELDALSRERARARNDARRELYSHYDPDYDFKAKDGDCSLREDALAVNPHYFDGQEYRENCTHCSLAFEMRCRGYDVDATPVLGGESAPGFMFRLAFSDYEAVDVDGGHDGTLQIIEKMREWGDGARAVINTVPVYEPGVFSAGHAYNVINRKGNIIFVDSQSGAIMDTDSYGDGIHGGVIERSSSADLLRVDQSRVYEIPEGWIKNK